MKTETIEKLIELYKYCYGLTDVINTKGEYYLNEEIPVDMEEFNWDDYNKPFIWKTKKDKENCIKRIFEERIDRNLEWDLEDELAKSKYKNKGLTKEQIKAIKKKVRDTISSNIPIEEQLELYESVWPSNKNRPTVK